MPEPTDPKPFQFHKGTIKTEGVKTPQLRSFEFQFHKGTIKTLRNIFVGLGYSYFNSIKVRLKLALTSSAFKPSLFQFHKGRIKTN